MRIAVAILVRLGSKRLPSKHLLPYDNQTYLGILCQRLMTQFSLIANGKIDLIICSGKDTVNDPLTAWCEKNKIQLFRGNDQHIPKRLAECVEAFELDGIIAVDGDDILVAPESIVAAKEILEMGQTIVQTKGFPFGMNVSGYNGEFLKEKTKEWKEEKLETGWGRAFHDCALKEVKAKDNFDAYDHHRYTLDYEEDALFFKAIFDFFKDQIYVLSTSDIVRHVEEKSFYIINKTVHQDYWLNFKSEMISESKNENEQLRERLHKVIPGGAHTYSRGDDQFSNNTPALFERGEGCHLWTRNGDRFLDFGMGLRSVNIGYANREINDAFYHEAMKGNNLTRASYTELMAAERLVELVDAAEMVKFAKHGSTVTTAAVKLARAYTGRKRVLIPSEQPFFSFDDWFIGTTPLTKGTLEESAQFTNKFNFGDISSMEVLFQSYPGEIAAVLLEPATHISPCQCENNFGNCMTCPSSKIHFLHQVKELCHKNGALFILDEMITGFRWNVKGAQHFYGIEPDLCTFGKAMANGFAVAALAGKREFMRLGDINEIGMERVFLTSTTHGAEMGALGAFLKTLEIIERDNVISHIWQIGGALKKGMVDLANKMGLQSHFEMTGYDCSPLFMWKDGEGHVSMELRTLFLQEMANRKIIMSYISPSYAHTMEDIDFTLEKVTEVFSIMSTVIDSGFESKINGPVVKPVFRKYN